MFAARSWGLGGFLIRAGAIASGAIALGGTVGLIIGAIARDVGLDVDHWALATKGAALGGLFGVVYAIAEKVQG